MIETSTIQSLLVKRNHETILSSPHPRIIVLTNLFILHPLTSPLKKKKECPASNREIEQPTTQPDHSPLFVSRERKQGGEGGGTRHRAVGHEQQLDDPRGCGWTGVQRKQTRARPGFNAGSRLSSIHEIKDVSLSAASWTSLYRRRGSRKSAMRRHPGWTRLKITSRSRARNDETSHVHFRNVNLEREWKPCSSSLKLHTNVAKGRRKVLGVGKRFWVRRRRIYDRWRSVVLIKEFV